MGLNNIEITLNSSGYYTYQQQAGCLAVARKLSDENPMLIHLKDFFCKVYLEGDQLRVVEFKAQIPDDKFFDSESQVIAFIKKQFPLQEKPLSYKIVDRIVHIRNPWDFPPGYGLANGIETTMKMEDFVKFWDHAGSAFIYVAR